MKKILIVDDDKALASDIKEFIEYSHENIYIVDIAFSPKEAKQKLSENSYALVLSDVCMPVTGGLDVFLFLKSNCPDIPFIAMTAQVDSPDAKKLEQIGGIRIIEKPFQFRNLSVLIEELINTKINKSEVQGDFNFLELTSILQMIHLERKTALFQVIFNDKEGFLVFREGEIIDAFYENESGYEAAIKLISKNEGDVHILPDTEFRPVSIKKPFMEILMDAAKFQDDSFSNDSNEYSKQQLENENNNDNLLSKLSSVPGFLWGGIISKDGKINKTSSDKCFDDLKQLSNILNYLSNTSNESLSAFSLESPILTQFSGRNGIIFFTQSSNSSNYIVLKINKNVSSDSIAETLYSIILE